MTTASNKQLNKKFRSLENFGIYSIIALLLLTCLGVSLALAIRAKVDFDEGFNLQVPTNLAQNGIYGTTVSWGRPFDDHISTGPTVLAPVALIFRLDGVGLIQGRVVPFLYMGGVLILAVLLLRKSSGLPAAFLGLAWMACTPDFFQFGPKVLGEIPALAFFLLAMLTFDRVRPIRLGALLGLALLTKFAFILTLAPLAILFILEGRSSWRFYLKVLGSFLMFPLGWEIVKLVFLGWQGYLDNTYLFLKLISENTGLQANVASTLAGRVLMLITPFYRLPTILVLVGLATVLFVQVLRLKQSLVEYPARAWMTLFSLTFLAWWLVASKTGWPRHLLPGLCVIALTAADGLVWSIGLLFKHLNHRISGWPWIALQIIILTGVAMGMVAVPLKWQRGQVQAYLNSSLLPAQTELAAKLVQIDQQGGAIATWSWFQVPEMSFLSQVRFFDLKAMDSQGLPSGSIYVLASKQLFFGADTDRVLQQYCGEIVYENAGYVLYQYKKRSSK